MLGEKSQILWKTKKVEIGLAVRSPESFAPLASQSILHSIMNSAEDNKA